MMRDRKKAGKKKHSTWRGILRFAGGERAFLALSAALSIFGVVCGILPYLALWRMAEICLEGGSDRRGLFLMGGFAAGACVLQGLLQGGSTLISHRSAFRILEKIRVALTEKMNRLSMGTIKRASLGEYKNLILDEVEKLEYPLAHVIPEVTGNLSAFLLVFGLMLYLNVKLALSALVTLPAGFLIMKGMFRGYGERYGKFMAAGERLNKIVVEYINGIEVIKVFNRGGNTFEKMKEAVLSFRDFTLAWYRHNWPYNAAYSVILPASVTGVLPVGLALLRREEISLAALLLFLLLSFALIPPLIKLTEFIDNFAVIVKTEQEVEEFLSREEPGYPDAPVPVVGFDLSLEQVSFSYGNEKTVREVSALIPAAGLTAIVGESGSGKTTLLRLIARFWDVTSGRIRVGGRDIRQIPQEQLMELVSIVDQDNFLFDRTIRDNILLGKPEAQERELEAAISAAGCREILERLEKGWDTVVGNGGGLVSAGERQRVCLARAFLKDAPILLLDEPTASLDLENEYKVQQALGRLMEKKTVVMAAHRLRTAVSARQILVMEQGRLVGAGTHDTLLKDCPEYARLWKACVSTENWSLGGDARV